MIELANFKLLLCRWRERKAIKWVPHAQNDYQAKAITLANQPIKRAYQRSNKIQWSRKKTRENECEKGKIRFTKPSIGWKHWARFSSQSILSNLILGICCVAAETSALLFDSPTENPRANSGATRTGNVLAAGTYKIPKQRWRILRNVPFGTAKNVQGFLTRTTRPFNLTVNRKNSAFPW